MNVNVEKQDDDALSKMLKVQTEAGKAIIDATQNIAGEYANLAPGRKPAYLGIILVIVSIFIEVANAVVPGFSFSETMLITMLISGIVILVAGSVLEGSIFFVQMKSLREEIKNARVERTNILERFIGGKKSE